MAHGTKILFWKNLFRWILELFGSEDQRFSGFLLCRMRQQRYVLRITLPPPCANMAIFSKS